MSLRTEKRMQEVTAQVMSCNVPNCAEEYPLPLMMLAFSGEEGLAVRPPHGWIMISPWGELHMPTSAMHCCPKHAAALLKAMNDVAA